LHLFGKKKVSYCANCDKELNHKYKPSREWNINGLLCADCHIEKTKEFVLKKQEEKRRLEDICAICKKDLIVEIDKNTPRWQWNMEAGMRLCKICFDKRQLDYDKLLNLCALCDKRIGLIRYNPKPKWNIEGQLCRDCWDKLNQTRK
jgi:hypothetical protein